MRLEGLRLGRVVRSYMEGGTVDSWGGLRNRRGVILVWVKKMTLNLSEKWKFQQKYHHVQKYIYRVWTKIENWKQNWESEKLKFSLLIKAKFLSSSFAHVLLSVSPSLASLLVPIMGFWLHLALYPLQQGSSSEHIPSLGSYFSERSECCLMPF